MVTTFTLMNVSKQLLSPVLFYTALKNSSCTSVYQLVVDDGVCTRFALDSPSFCFVRGKGSLNQKISDRLCPCWSADNHHDHCLLWYDCFFKLGLLCFFHLSIDLRTN